MDEIRHVSIDDVLFARDERAKRQRLFLEKHSVPVVTFTMNIPGSIKYNQLIGRAFHVGKERIILAFEKLHAEIKDVFEQETFTGCEGMWVVKADAIELKKMLCLIEETDDLGRLFDMDVIAADGQHLSRNAERPCLICGRPVRACARSRSHNAEELFLKTQEIISSHFQQRFVRKVGEAAQRALLYEAVTTPKPGLVDCENNGAHQDMNLFHFMESAALLRGYFEECTQLGILDAGHDALQLIGLEAEKRMFRQIGVNTHKGAVFALGILCYACGNCGEQAKVKSILEAASKIGEQYLLQMQSRVSLQTGGEVQYACHGITGARGEAASGFATVRDISLPVFENALQNGKTWNEAGISALLALMRHVKDSNVIRRGGMEAQKWMEDISSSLYETEWNNEMLSEMNRQFTARNISPGGCADLLAVTYFLHFILNSLYV